MNSQAIIENIGYCILRRTNTMGEWETIDTDAVRTIEWRQGHRAAAIRKVHEFVRSVEIGMF